MFNKKLKEKVEKLQNKVEKLENYIEYFSDDNVISLGKLKKLKWKYIGFSDRLEWYEYSANYNNIYLRIHCYSDNSVGGICCGMSAFNKKNNKGILFMNDKNQLDEKVKKLWEYIDTKSKVKHPRIETAIIL